MKIKICGLMTKEDCAIMNCFEPDYCGVVFADGRHKVSDSQAGIIRTTLKKEIPLVGVFADDDPDRIAALFNAGTIQVIQLHGSEDEAYIQTLKEKIAQLQPDKRRHFPEFEGELPIIKVAKVQSTADIEKAEETSARVLLLDTYVPGQGGGTGKRFDLTLIPKMSKPYYIAGGLTPENLQEVLSETPGPFGIDISSGVEADGHKDWKKVEKLMLVMEPYRIRQA